MKDKKMNAIINTLMGYLRCDKETATLMFNGVQTFNGDKYSAYMNENRLAIYKNGIYPSEESLNIDVPRLTETGLPV